MKATVGDICNAKAVQEAFAGVDCVIHTAALVDVGMFPDTEALEAVNVEGGIPLWSHSSTGPGCTLSYCRLRSLQ